MVTSPFPDRGTESADPKQTISLGQSACLAKIKRQGDDQIWARVPLLATCEVR